MQIYIFTVYFWIFSHINIIQFIIFTNLKRKKIIYTTWSQFCLKKKKMYRHKTTWGENIHSVYLWVIIYLSQLFKIIYITFIINKKLFRKIMQKEKLLQHLWLTAKSNSQVNRRQKLQRRKGERLKWSLWYWSRAEISSTNPWIFRKYQYQLRAFKIYR